MLNCISQLTRKLKFIIYYFFKQSYLHDTKAEAPVLQSLLGLGSSSGAHTALWERLASSMGCVLCWLLAQFQPSLTPLPSLGSPPHSPNRKTPAAMGRCQPCTPHQFCVCAQLCWSVLLSHHIPRTTPDCGFLYAVFAYPELKIVPNFVNTLCCCGCKFIIYVVSCMIFNLWQL